MAHMFPEFFPGEQSHDHPEYLVYQTMRSLPDNYFVFYSKKFKGGMRSKEECEVDFIVFDGKSALLCVEVKGGFVQYDGQADAWFQNGDPLMRGPDRQASAATHAIIDYLRQFADKLSIGWCLCFPNCSLPPSSAAPSGIPRSVLIDEAGLLEPSKAISLVESYYKKQFVRDGLKKSEAVELVRMLTRGLGFVRKIGVRIARDRQQIIEVTNEQLNVLLDLMVNSKMAVRGVAGSGKTLIAQEFARQLAAEGKTVLLLFFNRMIANSVRNSFDRDSTITCTTFHSFARDRISANNPDWWAENKSSAPDFWNIDVPLKLAECAESDDSKFDAVIVDEGQDFKRTWFEILEEYTSDRFVVFYDEAQDIFGHWNELPWGASTVPRKVLTRNCRNTISIVRHLADSLGKEISAFDLSPVGEDVTSRTFPDIQSQRIALKLELTRLLNEGVEPRQIVLIIDDKRQNSALADLDRIGKIPIEDIGRTYHPRSKAIRYTNTNLFKGLESDVVFLLRTKPADANPSLHYVASSRATTLLFDYKATPKD